MYQHFFDLCLFTAVALTEGYFFAEELENVLPWQWETVSCCVSVCGSAQYKVIDSVFLMLTAVFKTLEAPTLGTTDPEASVNTYI